MPITIITIGKKHDMYVKGAIERYERRLKKPFDISWLILPHSSYEADKAREEESEKILSKITPDDILIVLDERGRLLDSPNLSSALSDFLDQSLRVKIVIGGAYGVSEQLRKRATFIWSLSPLVFPHQLVRLILVEQLYRSYMISKKQPYHND